MKGLLEGPSAVPRQQQQRAEWQRTPGQQWPLRRNSQTINAGILFSLNIWHT